MRLVKHLAPVSRNTHTSFENAMQKIEKIFDGGEFPHVEEDGVEEFRMNMKAHAEKAYDSGNSNVPTHSHARPSACTCPPARLPAPPNLHLPLTHKILMGFFIY